MLVLELGTHYSGKTYNIISKNCNHFGDEFSKRLCGKGIPGWINRLAYFGNGKDRLLTLIFYCLGSFFSCIIPADEFGPGPVQPNNSPKQQHQTVTNINNNQFKGKPRKLTE